MWRKSVGLICLLSLLLCGMTYAESGFLNWLGIRGSIYYGDFWYSASEFESSYYQITQYRYKDGTVDFFKGDLGEGNLSFAEWMETDENPFRKMFDGWRIDISEPTSVAGFEAERVTLSGSDLQGEVRIIHAGTRDIYCGYSGGEEDCRRFVPEFNRILNVLSIFEPVTGLEWTGGKRTIPNFQVRNVEFGTNFQAGRAREYNCLLDMPDSLEGDFISIHCSQLKNGEEVQFSPEVSIYMGTPTITIRPYQSVGMSYVEMVVDDGTTSWDLAEYFHEVDLYDKESVVLRDDLYYEIAALDLDGDYDNELIALAGDGRTELEIIVFKYRDGILWPLYQSVGTGVAYLQQDDPSIIYVEGLRDEVRSDSEGDPTETAEDPETDFAFSSVELGVGETICLEMDLNMVNGTAFSSDNERIAIIDSQTGEITGVSVGIAQIQVIINGKGIGICSVRVYNAPTSVSIERMRVAEHQSAQIIPIVPKGSASHFKYEVRDPSIISVDSSGKVHALREGTTSITVSTYNGYNDTCDITVYVPTYRALLIGEKNYEKKPLHADIDIEILGDMLGRVNNGAYQGNVTTKLDAKASEFKDLIEEAFSDATEDDVSLFYYSGHGVEDLWAPKELELIDGDLYTVDNGYVSLVDISRWLSHVPGKIIVILDTCRSGISVESYEDMAQEMLSKILTADRSNVGVLRNQGKFYVITGAAYRENAYDSDQGGLLTNSIVSNVNHMLNADEKHSDYQLLELYDDVVAYVSAAKESQHPQVFPQNSEYVVFWNEVINDMERVEIADPTLDAQGLGNLPGNLANGGFAAAGDGMSFYADGSVLWRIGSDSESAVKLAEGSFDCLNYLDGYVYAVMEHSDTALCYDYFWNVHDLQGDPSVFEDASGYNDTCAVRVPVRISADGAGILQLLGPEQAENCSGISEYRCMTVADGYIYYVGGNETPFSYQLYGYNYILGDYGMCNYESRRCNSIYRMRLDGSDVVELIPNIGNLAPELATDGEQLYVLKNYETFSEGVPVIMQSYDMEGNLLWEVDSGDDVELINECGLVATDQGAITLRQYSYMDGILYWYSTDGTCRVERPEHVWPLEPAIVCDGYLYSYYSIDDHPYSDDDELYNPHNIAILRSSMENPGVKETICRGTFFYSEYGDCQYIRMNVLDDWLYIRFLQYSDIEDDNVGVYCRYNMATGETQMLSNGVAHAETLIGFFGYTAG